MIYKMENTNSTKTTEEQEKEKKDTKSNRFNLDYMHNPPTIMPNFGKKRKSALPKTKVSRVLLYDNVTQQQMLDVKLSHIKIEQNRSSRLLDLHRRSFIARQKRRQQKLQEAGIVLPDINVTPEKNDSPSRIASKYSKRSMSSRAGLKSELTDEIDGLKLPELHQIGNKRHVIFKLKDENGQTQVFHTIDEDNLFSDIVPLHSFYSKTTDDPRFQGLENTLSRLDLQTDGFNELSPSFRREVTRIPEHLISFQNRSDTTLSSTI